MWITEQCTVSIPSLLGELLFSYFSSLIEVNPLYNLGWGRQTKVQSTGDLCLRFRPSLGEN